MFSGANMNSFAILGKKKLQNFQYHKSKRNKFNFLNKKYL